MEDRPSGRCHEEHLQDAEHGGDTGSDRGDGVSPQDEVDCEREARSCRLPALDCAPGPLAALLQHCEQTEGRKGQQAAKECRRGRADAGKLHKDG
jgi:hypothetical protein